MIKDHSDDGASKELMNPYPELIHQFLWCTIMQVILAHWSLSRSSQRNVPHPEILTIANRNAESVQGDWVTVINNGRNWSATLISCNVKVTLLLPLQFLVSLHDNFQITKHLSILCTSDKPDSKKNLILFPG